MNIPFLVDIMISQDHEKTAKNQELIKNLRFGIKFSIRFKNSIGNNFINNK